MFSNLYRYPAIFTREEDGQFTVEFPDLKCATCAETEEKAGVSAKELLEIELLGLIEDGETIPNPSPITKVKLNVNDRAVMVDVTLPKTRWEGEGDPMQSITYRGFNQLRLPPRQTP
ncbi:MAG: type II toxin-antitoxin system HicB family antitoxin [Ruminococcus sp.]|jgi:predicted RNase H-like HicB family nuclease|nr:type II toxin-antitoxin system HicB family antitoxin [Ruminococcus sp.]